MHGRKASNPVIRLRIEETSVIKNLKTDNFKNSRPSSRGMMVGSNNIINNSHAKLQQSKESPAGLRLRLGANIEKLRSPSRLRVDSTPRFKNKKLSSPFGPPSGRSTPPSPLANSARKKFFKNNSTSSLSGVGDIGGSSPDSNRGRSPSPLSLSMQNTNSYKNHNTTPRSSRNTSTGTESLRRDENKLLHANDSSIASTPRSSIFSNKNSPAQQIPVSPSLSTRTNRSSGSSNFDNNDSISPSSMHQFQNINFDISKNNNNHRSEDGFNSMNNPKYRSSKLSTRKHVNIHKPIDSNDNKKNLSKANKVAIEVTPTKSMKEEVDNDIRPFHGYNINLKHLRKDLENKGYFNDNGDINILSRYVRNESYNLTETVNKFVNNIDSFQKYVDQNCTYLVQMAKKVDNNKLNLIGQRMQQIDKAEKNKRKRQDLTNDIELLSMRSERLDIEYASLLRTLERQQALLKRLSSD
jgi:hypothetical protein